MNQKLFQNQNRLKYGFVIFVNGVSGLLISMDDKQLLPKAL